MQDEIGRCARVRSRVEQKTAAASSLPVGRENVVFRRRDRVAREPAAVCHPKRSARAGAKLCFLPKYSPDLSPIEQAFAKLKRLSRNAAARTVEALVAAAEKCANYFANAGFGLA
jgi:transposase